MVTLIIRTCNVDALYGPDFVLVQLSVPLVQMLESRRQLAQALQERDAAFDSLAFNDAGSVWFLHFEKREELLDQAANDGWAAVSSGLFGLPEADEDARPVTVKTDTQRIVVWQTGFRFTCCMKGTETVICSESVEFADLNELLSDLSPQRTQSNARRS